LVPATGSRIRRPGEDMFVELTQDEPAIAGFYFDENKNAVAFVTDSSRFGSARAALARHLVAHRLELPAGYQNAPILVRKADYLFQQLSDWRDDAVDKILGVVPGVIFVDLDEARNRVTIGYDSHVASALSQARSLLVRLGIPELAVNFSPRDLIQSLTGSAPPSLSDFRFRASARSFAPPPSFMSADTLRGIADTLGGGIQIMSTQCNPCNPATLGLIADSAGTARGILTVSHIGGTFLGLDYAKVWQPTASYNDVGTETDDPSSMYRNSDATFFHLNGSKPGKRGAVARTTDRHSGSAGAITIHSTNPWINLANAQTYIPSGLTVDKVGRTTGWTYGTINGTDISTTDQGVYFYHQYTATTYAQGGDSGSPIFTYDGADGGSFYGIAWGWDGSSVYFSPYQQIVNDLGAMTVGSEITVGTPSVTASFNGSNPYLSWSAVSTTNTTATTQYRIYRAIWNASNYTWTSTGTQIAQITSTSYTDNSLPFTADASTGTTQPDECTYTFTYYWVVAYNSGIASGSTLRYFRGPDDGPNPGQHGCFP
jgi:hypothetical protein